MKWFFVSFFFLTFLALNAQSHGLTINIKDITPPEGHIQLAIFNTPEKFPKEGKEFKVIQIPIDGSTVSITIHDLAPGTYAIALYHDLNKDGICNKNILGIPTEGYGFSNNVRPKLRPPRFEKAAFEFKEVLTINISIFY